MLLIFSYLLNVKFLIACNRALLACLVFLFVSFTNASSAQNIKEIIYPEEAGGKPRSTELKENQRTPISLSIFTPLLNDGKGIQAKEQAIQLFTKAKDNNSKFQALNTLLEVCMFVTDNDCFSKFWDANSLYLFDWQKNLPINTEEEKEYASAVTDSNLSKYAYRLSIYPSEELIKNHITYSEERMIGSARYEYAGLRTALEARLSSIAGRRDISRKLLRRARALVLSRNLNYFTEQLTLANVLECSAFELSDTQDVSRFLKAVVLASRENSINLDAYINPYVAVRIYRVIYEASAIDDKDRKTTIEILHRLYQSLEIPPNSTLSAQKESFYAILALDKFFGLPIQFSFDPSAEFLKYDEPVSVAGISVKFLLAYLASPEQTIDTSGLDRALNWSSNLQKNVGPNVSRQYEPIFHFMKSLKFRSLGNQKEEITSLNRYVDSQLELYRNSGLSLLDNAPILNYAMSKLFRYVVGRFIEVDPSSEALRQLTYFAIVTFNASKDADIQSSYAMLSSSSSELQSDQINYYIKLKHAYNNAVSTAYYNSAKHMSWSRDQNTFDGGVGRSEFSGLLEKFQMSESQLSVLSSSPNLFTNLDYKKLIPDRPNHVVLLYGTADGYVLSLSISKTSVSVQLVDTWKDPSFVDAANVLKSRNIDQVPELTLKQLSMVVSNRLLGKRIDKNENIQILTGPTVFGIPYTLLSNPSNGHWLIEDMNISTFASVYHRDLASKTINKKRKSDLVAFANPRLRSVDEMSSVALVGSMIRGKNGGVDSLAELPETEIEARALGASFAGKSEFFFGRDANFKNLLLTNFDDVNVLSLSTHGVLAGEIDGAVSSSIILSSTETNSGIIPAESLFSIAGSPKYVILSTCNSGTSARPFDRSEIDSLASVFLLKGSQAVVASYWQVNSQATTELMKRLSTALASKQNFSFAFSESLRSLQKDKNWSHPSIWAAFAIVGGELKPEQKDFANLGLKLSGSSFHTYQKANGSSVVFSKELVNQKIQSFENEFSQSIVGGKIDVKRFILDPKFIDVAYSTNSTFGQLKALLDINGNWHYREIKDDNEKTICLLNGLAKDWIIINLFNTRTHIFSLYYRTTDAGVETLISSQSHEGCISKFQGPISYQNDAQFTLFPLVNGFDVLYSESISRSDKERFFNGLRDEVGVDAKCSWDFQNNFYKFNSELTVIGNRTFGNTWIDVTNQAGTLNGVQSVWLNPCSRRLSPRILTDDWFDIEDPLDKWKMLLAANRPYRHIEDLISAQFGDVRKFWWDAEGDWIYVLAAPGNPAGFYQHLFFEKQDKVVFGKWSNALTSMYAYNIKTKYWSKISSAEKCQAPKPLGFKDKALFLCNDFEGQGSGSLISITPVH